MLQQTRLMFLLLIWFHMTYISKYIKHLGVKGQKNKYKGDNARKEVGLG